MDERALSFGPFVLHPSQRLLQHDGQPVKIGSRALDLLVALTERAGQILANEDLVARAWPNTFVESSSLRVHIVNLRKALGDDPTESRFVANIPGRGYCFVAPVAQVGGPPTAAAVERGGQAMRKLPVAITRPIGRDRIVATLTEELETRRLMTIVGPGGIGKTTVALAVAQASAVSFRDGGVFVDLACVSDPAVLPATLAAALGRPIHSADAERELMAQVADRNLLIVFDGCEHLIEAVTILTERLLHGTTGVAVLASSREPMRAEGEWVHRLAPLDVPPEGANLTLDEAMGFSAVRLFVQRAAAALGGFEPSVEMVGLVVEICRRLDGIALALELAAGRLATIGLADLASSLDDCFHVLTQGRRTALPRHQTLRATLDWSYQLLSQAEQAVFRRLGVFSGAFPLSAARAVASCQQLPGKVVEEAIASLVAKSLLTAEVDAGTIRFRLLDTTRAYSREKMTESGEKDRLQRHHAHYCRDLFRQAEAEWETRPTGEWMAAYVPHLGDLRAALDWAADGADPSLVVALTVAAVPLWIQLSLIDECLGWVQGALVRVEADPSADERVRMRLYAVRGWPRMRAPGGPMTGAAAWQAVLEIAERVGDLDYQARALWALWVDRSNHGEPREALTLAERYGEVAARSGVEADIAIGDRMRAHTLHLLGDQASSLRLVTGMLDRYVAPANRSHVVRFQYDQRITARVTLARVLWVLGRPEQALDEIRCNVAAAEALGHALTLAHVLSDAACPVALLAGDLDAAERYVLLLRAQTRIHALDVWHTYADCFEAELLIRRGQVQAGVRQLKDAIDTLRRSGFVLYLTAFLGSLARGLALADNVRDGLAALDEAFAQCRRTGEAWYLPELERLDGDLLRQQGDNEAAAAAFDRALGLARSQGAEAWELRAAVSLGRLRHDLGQGAAARNLLMPITARLADRQATDDFREASNLLAAIGT